MVQAVVISTQAAKQIKRVLFTSNLAKQTYYSLAIT